jgi:hypothetical protein
MDDKREDLVSRLLNAEPVDAGRLANLRQEMTAMIELKWSPAKRAASAIGGGVLVVLGSGAGAAFLHGAHNQPPLIRMVGTIAMVVCIALGVLMLWFARRGTFHRRRDNILFLLLACVTMGGLGLVFLNEGWMSDDARMQFTGQLMLALLGFSMLLHFMEQHQLSTMQRLLELEYRLTQMSEKLDSREASGADKP